jgi:transcriptional regulator with XRE-family HTH domain
VSDFKTEFAAEFAAKLQECILQRGLSLSDAARALGVSRQALHMYISGRVVPRADIYLKISTLFGLDMGGPLARVEGMRALRESRARNRYRCDQCHATIGVGHLYYRHDPHPIARWRRGEPVEYFCYSCVRGSAASAEPPEQLLDVEQIVLPFGEPAIVLPTRVELIDISKALTERILKNPDEIYSIGPSKFEDLVLDRLAEMGLRPQRVGANTYARDGGIDIVFCGPSRCTFPFLGAVQVKHHRSPLIKTGPAPINQLAGVLGRGPFSAGIIVTNTSFTPSARWVASQRPALVRLRDLTDLMRWLKNNFTDAAEWKDIPEEIEVCPGLTVTIRPHVTK